LPQASVYPAEMRATRHLLHRRCHLRRKRAELLAHMQNTHSQYNLPAFGKKLAYKANREGVEEHFPDPSVRKTIAVDVALIDHYDQLLGEVELYITRTAKAHDVQTFARLQSVPGIGQILALVLLYEIQDIARFPRVPDFASYCRFVKCAKESAGKRLGTSGRRSATCICAGPLRKPPCSSYGTTSPAKSTFRNWNTNRQSESPHRAGP
jgi:transposase